MSSYESLKIDLNAEINFNQNDLKISIKESEQYPKNGVTGRAAFDFFTNDDKGDLKKITEKSKK